MLLPGKVLLQPERVRRRLLAAGLDEKEKFLATGRKVDELILEYYRVKFSFRQL